MPFDVGPWELVILLGVLVLLFGAKGVPDVAKRLGMGMREMKNAMGEVDPRRMLDPAEPPAPRRRSRTRAPTPTADQLVQGIALPSKSGAAASRPTALSTAA